MSGYRISNKLVDEISNFLHHHTLPAISRDLRNVMIRYVQETSDTHKNAISGFRWLFQLLDIMEQEKILSQRISEAPIATITAASVADITEFLVTMIQPEKIFAVAHNDVTSHQAYDLLIVVPDTAKATFKEYETLIELACFKHINVTCSIHQANFIARQLAVYNLFYTNTCRKVNLVYDNGFAPLILPDIALVMAAKEKASQCFRVHFSKAVSFLSIARNLSSNGCDEITVFMLHQAAELTLRAVIMAIIQTDLKTHSILELLKNCRRITGGFRSVLSSENSGDMRLIKILENAYLHSRYQEHYDIAQSDIVLLLEKITLLQTMADSIVSELLR